MKYQLPVFFNTGNWYFKKRQKFDIQIYSQKTLAKFLENTDFWQYLPNICPACRGRLRNLLADCCTVGLYCTTITRPQIFKRSLQVTVEAFFRM